VASDGGIFAFGNAQFYGSMGGKPLNKPVVGMAATQTGGGYWEVASDGGIFAFGNAQFYGSMGGKPLNKPIVGMAAAPGGTGYWFTAADGGVFAFGDARFYGSLGGVPQSRPIVAITTDAAGNGYWFTNNNGAVSAFGTASYWGSAPQVLNKPIVGMAEADASGQISGSPYPSGSYGYDISNWQCPKPLPPAPHTIGIVQVNGASFAPANPCLATEAAWAAGGLNLYTFLTYGTSPTSGDPACTSTASPGACEYGFHAALDAFGEAQAAGVDTSVAWWLDVEQKTPFWSSDVAANAALVKGAIDGLHYEGINSVGIYASPGVWNTIVGTTYQPAVPYWMADWPMLRTPPTPLLTGPADCSAVSQLASQYALPTGPVEVVQYTDNANGFDGDYAC